MERDYFWQMGSGANNEFEDITHIPLAQGKPQKHEKD